MSSSRRFYVHSLSFRTLCERSPGAASLLFPALCLFAVRKLLHSHFLEDGQLLGYIKEEQVATINEAIAMLESDKLTHVFRHIGMFSTVGGRRDLKPLLSHDEQVANTCFDGAYFTFATDHASADRMFSDGLPIKQLIACIALDPNDQAVADLTIVRGRKLVFLDSESIGGMVLDKKAYVQRSWTLPIVSVQNIKAAAISETRASLNNFFSNFDLGSFQSTVQGIIMEQAGKVIDHI
jgi:hypothetical protein